MSRRNEHKWLNWPPNSPNFNFNRDAETSLPNGGPALQPRGQQMLDWASNLDSNLSGASYRSSVRFGSGEFLSQVNTVSTLRRCGSSSTVFVVWQNTLPCWEVQCHWVVFAVDGLCQVTSTGSFLSEYRTVVRRSTLLISTVSCSNVAAHLC